MFFLLILLSYDNMIKDRVKARPSWKKHRGVKPLMETVKEETESLKKTCPSLPGTESEEDHSARRSCTQRQRNKNKNMGQNSEK